MLLSLLNLHALQDCSKKILNSQKARCEAENAAETEAANKAAAEAAAAAAAAAAPPPVVVVTKSPEEEAAEKAAAEKKAAAEAEEAAAKAALRDLEKEKLTLEVAKLKNEVAITTLQAERFKTSASIALPDQTTSVSATLSQPEAAPEAAAVEAPTFEAAPTEVAPQPATATTTRYLATASAERAPQVATATGYVAPTEPSSAGAEQGAPEGAFTAPAAAPAPVPGAAVKKMRTIIRRGMKSGALQAAAAPTPTTAIEVATVPAAGVVGQAPRFGVRAVAPMQQTASVSLAPAATTVPAFKGRIATSAPQVTTVSSQ